MSGEVRIESPIKKREFFGENLERFWVFEVMRYSVMGTLFIIATEIRFKDIGDLKL